MKNNVLIKLPRDPLFGMTKNNYIEEVKERLKGRVSEGYFFGSFPGPDFNKDSDIDMMLICDTGKAFQDRSMDFADLLDLVPGTDILVYTRDEFNRLIESPSPGFWKSVKESLVKFM